jgi:hypothetical protein
MPKIESSGMDTLSLPVEKINTGRKTMKSDGKALTRIIGLKH